MILNKAHRTTVKIKPRVYCGLSTASEVFLIFTTQLYQFLMHFSLFTLCSDKPEVFLPEYSQTAILHAAHFWGVVNIGFTFIAGVQSVHPGGVHCTGHPPHAVQDPPHAAAGRVNRPTRSPAASLRSSSTRF